MVGWLWLAPSTPVCRVRVVDMPLPQLRHHRLASAGRLLPAQDVVELPVGARDVVLVGPRYSGERVLPAHCLETLVLHAKPRPARLEVEDLPPRAVISCHRCPGIDPNANYLPAHLPSMVMDGPAIAVSLWVRAPGFHAVEYDLVLYPGTNVVRIPLQPR